MPKRSRKKHASKTALAVGVPTRAPFSREWLWGLLLLAAVFVVYLPVWNAGYIWDDDLMLTSNPCVVGPLGLKEIWTSDAADICPLTLTSFWFLHQLFGLNPLPYHLINVVLQGVSAIVLWRVLLRMEIPGAWLGAAIWALHPVMVESVAWIAEMKNVQSGLFFLLTILFFLKFIEATDRYKKKTYIFTLIFAACAIASKSSTVILPMVLCLCAWWIERRWLWRNLLITAPIFLMSLLAGLSSIWTQRLQSLVANDAPPPRALAERLASAGDTVWFYLGKLIWPRPLITVYPKWTVDTAQITSYLPLVAVIVLLAILFLARSTWGRPWFFAFVYFLVALAPVLGLVDNFIFRYSLVFDHLQYLASIGPLVLAGAGLTRFMDGAMAGNIGLRAAFTTCVLFSLSILTYQRALVYENSESLWTDTLKKNPGAWIASSNLAQALLTRGQLDDAITHYETALRMEPHSAETHYDFGLALFEKGRVDDAIDHYRTALSIYPGFFQARYNLGTALLHKGSYPEAISAFQAAIAARPTAAEGYYGLGNALATSGQMTAAIEPFEKSLEINPNQSETHNNLGAVYYQLGNTEKALPQFQEALRLDPNNTQAQTNVAKATARLQRDHSRQ